jgi:hypothetical protein
MEKQEVKSKWDELARQIGAEISPEIEQLVEAPPKASAEVETQEPFQTESGTGVAAPVRPAAGWDNLASAFGLPVPEPPVEVAVERATPPVQRVEETRPPVEEEEDIDRPSRDRGRPNRRDRSDSRRESRGPLREEGRSRGQERSHQREERPHRRETHPRRAPERAARTEIDEVELQESSSDIAESTVAPAPSSPVSQPLEPTKPAAVSLWHKIFGLPAEQTAKQEQVQQTTERAALDPQVEEPLAPRDDHFESAAIASSPYDSEEALSTELDDEVISPGDPEAVPSDRNRPRRRRRGRGGRGRRAESDRDEGRAFNRRHHEPEHADARDGLEGDEAFHDRVADTDDEDDEDEHESGLEESELDEDGAGLAESGEGSVSRAKSALQRSIPTWDEAIGYIIDVNMQGRSQRRQSSHSGARSRPSRGRPRGGRRRS